MKTRILLNMIVAIVFLAGCDTDPEVYSWERDGLNFTGSTTTNFSFVYHGSTLEQYSLMVPVATLGFLPDKDRLISIIQIPSDDEDVENAVAGVHYVAFDDPSLKELYTIKAGQNTIDIPIVLLRNPSLKDKVVTLKIQIDPDGPDFGLGKIERSTITVTITDQLSKPKYWNQLYVTEYGFGAWGKVKHQFMIDVTGFTWDDDFFYNILGFTEGSTNSNYDGGYITHLTRVLNNELDRVNEERRVANGGVADPLKEEDGTIVVIKGTRQ